MRHRRRRKYWNARTIAVLVRDYADMPTWRIARAVKRPRYQVYAKAQALGLKKSTAYLAGPEARRLRTDNSAGIPFRFKPGHVPANKGLRRPGWAPGRMRETQFKKGKRNGVAARHWMPIGATRVADGYVLLKVADVPNVPYTVNWKALHIVNWERANGRPVPAGHCLRFRDGNALNTALENLELISRKEHALRNQVHRLPVPLKRAIYAKAALSRRINNMEKRNAKDA